MSSKAAATTTPQVIYEAWIMLGQSHAALKHWDPALAAFEQAALLEPQRGCAPPGRRRGRARPPAAATRRSPLPEGLGDRQCPETAARGTAAGDLRSLDRAAGRAETDRAEADRYRALRTRADGRIGPDSRCRASARRSATGNWTRPWRVAQRGVQSHPEDPLAYIALGRAQRANKDDAKAADAYRKAFETAKDAPALQMQLAEYLLQTGDPSDAAEAEKALRGLLARHAPACLRLVALLELREQERRGLGGRPERRRRAIPRIP